MPVVLLERLPLPSLQTYTTFSVGLLLCGVLFSHHEVSDEMKKAASNDTSGINNSHTLYLLSKLDNYFFGIIDCLLKETWRVWTLINMAYCCMILIGKTIQNMVFGNLRVSEQQHIQDKFWNFVFYKFIFIFGVMNVQNMDEVVMWCGWFSVLGFQHLLAQLCKDRFEYLSFSPSTPKWTHIQVLALLVAILIFCSVLVVISIFVGMHMGFNTFSFMVAECILLIVSTLYVITRYAIHLWDVNHEGVWENRGIYIYYSELIFELSALIIDFTHHLHMLLWSNIFLSMASLVICMQLRYLFYEFQRRIERHKNYRKVVSCMETKFHAATLKDLSENDDCAICWDKMEKARKLPCGHLFHNSCLRSWLEQDVTCPTCRKNLEDLSPTINRDRGAGDAEDDRTPNANTSSNLLSQIASWFPSFSVEVSHTQGMPMRQEMVNPNQTSRLDPMARQVQVVFPNIPLEALYEDLQNTNSVEQTIENILEGRLRTPPSSAFDTITTASPVYSGSLNHDTETLVGQTENEQNESKHKNDDTETQNLSVSNNFVFDENIPDFSSDNDDIDQSISVVSSGFRFSKSSSEREDILTKRKEMMVEQAKRKYLERINKTLSNKSSLQEED